MPNGGGFPQKEKGPSYYISPCIIVTLNHNENYNMFLLICTIKGVVFD